ncbi:MAG: hypothetical protein FJ090_05105 [Deltaproteobacteria bacterium]|nr:hypothetical protein [Deltaproteobacteria bacterium]
MLDSPDTTPAARDVLLGLLRKAGPGRRGEMALALSDTVRAAATAGARARAARDGRDADAEIRRLLLGEALASAVEAKLAGR